MKFKIPKADMIDGSKIIIRNKRLSDAKNEYEWQKDPELARLDATVPLSCTFEEFRKEFTSDLQYPSPSRRSFAVETRDGKHIGSCTYYNINEEKGEAELGIMIGDRSYWNKGYGTDTVSALIDYIFRRTKLNRIYLKTLEDNNRAHRCFEKCNLKPCGYMERAWYKFLLMEILRKQWQEHLNNSTIA